MGSDISLERVSRYFSNHYAHVDLISCRSLRRFEAGELVSESGFNNFHRSKRVAGLRTLLFRTQYLHERFNTPAIRRVIRQQLTSHSYDVVLASYLVTVPLLPGLSRKTDVFVWTHNDDFKWYDQLARTTRGALGRAVAKVSLRRLRRDISDLAARSVFIHVSEDDRKGFDRFVPGHRNIVTSIGTDIDTRPAWVEAPDRGDFVLSFIGSLGVNMAIDALNHFHDKFEPVLRKLTGGRFAVRVIGSQPSAMVKSLCDKAGWRLYGDVSDEDLSRHLGETTFTILPFSYSNGAKLKLLRSLGSGIPFLSTQASLPENFQSPPCCCFSDEPEAWVCTIRDWLAKSDHRAEREQLLKCAQLYSWPAVTATLVRAIKCLRGSETASAMK